MRIAVCPGSFDPVTMGHLDVFERASRMSDQVIVAVLINKIKESLFTVEERIEMLIEATAHLPNVTVDSFYGLLVDYCKDHEVNAIVKGLNAGQTNFSNGTDELSVKPGRDLFYLHKSSVQLFILESGQGRCHSRWRCRRAGTRSRVEAPPRKIIQHNVI